MKTDRTPEPRRMDAGVLKDDCSSIVAGHDGSRVRRDRARPRAEITISRMEAQEA